MYKKVWSRSKKMKMTRYCQLDSHLALCSDECKDGGLREELVEIAPSTMFHSNHHRLHTGMAKITVKTLSK